MIYISDLNWCPSADDGKSRAMLLQLLLKRIDQYASSSEECERERAVRTALALLHHFRALCTPGSCILGCNGSCMHLRLTSETGQSGVAGKYSCFSILELYHFSISLVVLRFIVTA